MHSSFGYFRVNLQNKKFLVTGSDGFIGSHLVELLVRSGYDVRAFVLYNSFGSWGWLDHLPEDVKGQFEVVAGDVRDPFGVAAAMKDCDVVLHLAALIAIPYSYHSPSTYVDTNVVGTLNVVQAARQQEVERVIVTSTSEVYGTARSVPITEEHPLQGQSPYSASKIGADAIALSYHMAFGTPVSVLRPFNTFGPRQSARAVIPTVITQIAAGCRTIKLGALHPTRDFTFVENTARGFVAAAASDAIVGEATNIGSGFEISIGDTVHLINELMGSDVEIETEDVRFRPEASEVERLFASTEKAERLLGWQPGGLQSFKTGLEQTIQWFSDPSNLAKYKTDRYIV
jgi:NAD dependent epimerase/dehydratase